MKVLVTGSAGHLGEALAITLTQRGDEVVGVDIVASPYTTIVGSIVDRDLARRAMSGVDVVMHAATLHKPHVATHSRQDFIDVNVTGSLNLLEEAAAAKVRAFIFTSTTSVFGDALTPADNAPAAWITEDVTPIPKNIYGVTKAAAEDLCQLFHRNQNLPIIVLRTSRFFPEDDDDQHQRARFSGENLKANEFLHRRVDIEDVVDAHLLAAEKAPALGFRRYIVSATTPFAESDCAALQRDAAAVVSRYIPDSESVYAARGWRMSPMIGRVYVNARCRAELGWRPRYDFRAIIARLRSGDDISSPMARRIGVKGYHAAPFADGPYPVE